MELDQPDQAATSSQELAEREAAATTAAAKLQETEAKAAERARLKEEKAAEMARRKEERKQVRTSAVSDLEVKVLMSVPLALCSA